MPIFKTVCAWCSRVISEEPCSATLVQMATDSNTKEIISHGLCPSCRERIEKKELRNQGGEHHVGLD